MSLRGGEQPHDNDYPHRPARLWLRRMIVGCIVLALLAGVVGPLVISALNDAARRGQQEIAKRELLALRNLDYPTLPPDSLSTLTHTEHMGGINITTGFVPLATAAKVQGKPDHAGVFFIEGRTRRDSSGWSRATVLVTIAGDRTNPVPQTQYQSTPLVLSIGGTNHAVYSTAWEASQLAAQFKDDRFASNMVFSIPTALYIAWLKEPTMRAALGPYTLTAPDDTRKSLIELGASMKP